MSKVGELQKLSLMYSNSPVSKNNIAIIKELNTVIYSYLQLCDTSEQWHQCLAQLNDSNKTYSPASMIYGNVVNILNNSIVSEQKVSNIVITDTCMMSTVYAHVADNLSAFIVANCWH